MAHWILALALMLALSMTAVTARAWLAGPLSCPAAEAERCTFDLYNKQCNEYHFAVDGMHVPMGYTDGGYFAIWCSNLKNLTLDNSAMPRFKSQMVVDKVFLQDCPAPRGSYSAVLQRFNVIVKDKVKLMGAGKLTGAHLAGLGDVHEVVLIDAELAPRTLAALAGLRALLLERVRLPPAELRELPHSLEELVLSNMRTSVPLDVLERLPALVNVTVHDYYYHPYFTDDFSNVSVALGGAVRVMALDTPATHLPSALSLALRSLTVNGWDERRPVPWTACALETLKLYYLAAEELPAGWVSDCVELRVLHVRFGMQLRALHETSLRGARHLQELSLKGCKLKALPVGLLDDAVELRELDLSRNFLKELPSSLFAQTRSLRTLDLSRNQLTMDVYTSLKVATSLHELHLGGNYLIDSSVALNLSIPLITTKTTKKFSWQ